jgi:hypothetical protein
MIIGYVLCNIIYPQAGPPALGGKKPENGCYSYSGTVRYEAGCKSDDHKDAFD